MLYPVIPAGGSGTRLWPLSRAGRPKFLHALTGTEASLLQTTVRRLLPVAPIEQIYVVTGTAHAAAVTRQLPALPEGNLLVEPTPRDNCAAIGLAASVIMRRDHAAVMGSFASDHLIADPAAFAEVVRTAVAGAESGLLMTVGIKPTHPETGYGYLQCGEPVGDSGTRMVEKFKEKPPLDLALTYVDSGEYLWNAGMFVWRTETFLSELERQQPQLYAGLQTIADAWETNRREAVLGEVWPTLPKIAVDYAVMEGAAAAGLVGTVPGDFGWNDVGDFETVGEVLPGDAAGNVVIAGADKPCVLLNDVSGTVVVPQSGRLIAALGLRDLVIVDTPDVLMICPRDRAQDVKKLVDELKERGDGQYL